MKERSPAFRAGYIIGSVTTVLLIVYGLVRLAMWLL